MTEEILSRVREDPEAYMTALAQYAEEQLAEPQKLDRPSVIARVLRARFGTEDREHFGAVYLDAQCYPTKIEVHSIGNTKEAMVDPRRIFKTAIEEGSEAIVLFHNHPSGRLEASPADEEATRRVYRGGQILGIKVYDHLIVTLGGYISLRSTNPGLFQGDWR